MAGAAPYREWFESAPCGLLQFTDDGLVTVANATLLARLGREREAVVGRSVETLMTLPTRIFYQTHLGPLLRLRGRLDEIYLTLRAADSGEAAFFVNAERREAPSGAVVQCALFPVVERRKFEDELLRARRDAEAALARNERLRLRLEQALADLQAAQSQIVREEKLASIGRVSSRIAHELKNPLNFVVNFALLAREQVDAVAGPLGDADADALATLRLNLDRVVDHGRRADAIIQRLRDHAGGGASPPPRPIAVNPFVEHHLARALLGRDAGLAVTCDLAPEAGFVVASASRLGRAVEALVENALDAVEARCADAGSTYRPAIGVRTRRDGGDVEIGVTDNGSGIAEADRVRLFEPLFTTHPPQSGHAGLGLSLAYEIVQAHGGTIDIGDAGDGAALTIRLPAA